MSDNTSALDLNILPSRPNTMPLTTKKPVLERKGSSKLTTLLGPLEEVSCIPAPALVYEQVSILPDKFKTMIAKSVASVVDSVFSTDCGSTQSGKKRKLKTILIGFKQHQAVRVIKDDEHCDRCCTEGKRSFDPLPGTKIYQGVAHPKDDFFSSEVMLKSYDEEKSCYEVVYAWIPSSFEIGCTVLEMLYATRNNEKLWLGDVCDCCGVLKIWPYEQLIHCLAKIAESTKESLTGEDENFLIHYVGKEGELIGSEVRGKASKKSDDSTNGTKSKHEGFKYDPSSSSDQWGRKEKDLDTIEREERLKEERDEEEQEEELEEDYGDYGQWFLTKVVTINPNNDGEKTKTRRMLDIPNKYWEISRGSQLFSFDLPNQCCSCGCSGSTYKANVKLRETIEKKRKATEELKESSPEPKKLKSSSQTPKDPSASDSSSSVSPPNSPLPPKIDEDGGESSQ